MRSSVICLQPEKRAHDDMASRIGSSSVESLVDAMQRLFEDHDSADIVFLLGRDEVDVSVITPLPQTIS